MSNLKIAENTYISKTASFYGDVTVETGCLIEKGVVIGDLNYSNLELFQEQLLSGTVRSLADFIAKTSKKTVIGRNSIIRSGAIVGAGAEIGQGSRVGYGSIIGSFSTLGANTIIGSHCFVGESTSLGENTICEDAAHIGNSTRIGERCKVFKASLIYDDVIIGNDCRIFGFVANRCKIGNNVSMLGYLVHGYRKPIGGLVEVSPIIEDRATVGMLATIIGCNVGELSYVGAGSVVTKSVPPKTVITGVPAMRQRQWVPK